MGELMCGNAPVVADHECACAACREGCGVRDVHLVAFGEQRTRAIEQAAWVDAHGELVRKAQKIRDEMRRMVRA